MGGVAAKGFVLKPGEGRSIDFNDGFPVSVKATREETGGAFSLIETSEAPGVGPPLHVHHDAAEAMYVLEGEYIVTLGERELACSAGSFIFIPAGTAHSFRVSGVTNRKLNLYAPAAMVGYFDDLSQAMRSGSVDSALVSKIAAKHSMEVLGPVPEGYL